MSTKTQPSLLSWEKLYKSALSFSELSPWKWMYDSQLFGVEDPKTQEIGYCCVMGNLGQMFALAVYRGVRGLSGYMKIASGNIKQDDPSALFVQDCLMVSFENRSNLNSVDLGVIKKLGLKFRGQNQWPQFRSFKPGLVPWYLDVGEVDFLITVLDQALYIANQVKNDCVFLGGNDSNKILVRVADQGVNSLIWKDVWRIPDCSESIDIHVPTQKWIKEMRLRLKQTDMIWETDFFYTPTPVYDKKIPYFPRLSLWMDTGSCMILSAKFSEKGDLFSFEDSFAEVLEQTDTIPKEILVREELFALALRPIAQAFNIMVRVVDKLKNIDHFKKDISKFLEI